MRFALLSFVGVSFALVGCADIAPPAWCHPGSAAFQQAQAQRTDPFPETDVGPEIVGGRPRDFQKPSAEPTRVQTEYSYAKRYGAPPAGLFRSATTGPRAPVSRYAGVPQYGPNGMPIYSSYPYAANPSYPAGMPTTAVALAPGMTPSALPAAMVASNPPTMTSGAPPQLLAPPLGTSVNPAGTPPPPTLLPQPQGSVAPSIQQGGNWIGGQNPRNTGPDPFR